MIKKIKEKTVDFLKTVDHKWDQLQAHSLGGKGNIKVICHGGAEQVTGSNFELQFQSGKKLHKILIDCGLPQGLDAQHKEWEPFNYDPTTIDYLLVTHAHMDHIGRIPFLFASGFNGTIYSTKATKEMSEVAFADALHIMQKDLDRGFLLQMPYTERDVQHALSKWKTVEYRQEINLGESIFAEFFNSSHVLGSAFIQINCGGKAGEKVLFTGDMGANSLLLPEADIPTDSDIVFMECVYGGRVHEHLEDRTEFLRETISEVINKHGTLVIPAFSIERTQEILLEINNFVEHKQVKILPVFLDSPLSIDITKIFHKHFDMLKESIRAQIKKGDDIFKFPGLHLTDTRDESIQISKIPGPKIIIAGSGMVAGGRVIHHVRNYLEGRNNTILLAGYQAPGTYGRLLTENKKEIIFYGEHLNVNAKVVQLEGYSAHRDKNDLLKFVEKVKKSCKSLNLILGDAESLLEFKRSVKENLNINAHICLKGETLDF
jgi:metallo-beta-lactamase family protein